MNYLLGLLLAGLSVASAQFFNSFDGLSVAIQPPPLQPTVFQPTFHQVDAAAPAPKRGQPHRAVVVNAENEARLPPELTNDFYKNPRVAQALAKDSWFGPGEEQVFNREADKIPRQQIAKLLRQAGFVQRRR